MLLLRGSLSCLRPALCLTHSTLRQGLVAIHFLVGPAVTDRGWLLLWRGNVELVCDIGLLRLLGCESHAII